MWNGKEGNLFIGLVFDTIHLLTKFDFLMDTPFPFSVAIKATTDLHEATMNAAIIQTQRAQMRY